MDREKDKLNIQLTDSAIAQIKLIKENDFTIEPEYMFRLKIGGKGCDGFTYETGFSEVLDDDIRYEFKDLTIVIDSFTAFYFKNGSIDFVNDVENNTDGFVIVNFDEKNHVGKFFKDETKVPKLN